MSKEQLAHFKAFLAELETYISESENTAEQIKSISDVDLAFYVLCIYMDMKHIAPIEMVIQGVDPDMLGFMFAVAGRMVQKVGSEEIIKLAEEREREASEKKPRKTSHPYLN